MAGRGGKAPKRKGDALEVKMLADQVRMGRLAYRLRQAGGCVVDVVNVERCQDGHCTVHGGRVGHIRLIQAKSTGKLPAAEREALITEAGKVDGIPVLACPDGVGVRYEVLSD